MLLQQTVSHIDFHDARIGRISFLAGGEAEIEFEHLCSYHDSGEESGEVWSSKAAIVLTGVNQLEIDGSIGRKDYVTEGALLDEQQREVSLLPIGSEKQASSLNLLLAGSGTKIRFAMATASLVRLDPVRKLEDWPD
jgi:hypothetical protein